ncbi:uncharacterized protein LOC124422857 [Vespa crabro]|uniref:uncharacterized protein LOC124422857 n=1 Tax=Vespa crabro TaxID=7445 RepID=UPI001F032465|nr:uncharacterized protein LOC124422857 [Vespa crabro]
MIQLYIIIGAISTIIFLLKDDQKIELQRVNNKIYQLNIKTIVTLFTCFLTLPRLFLSNVSIEEIKDLLRAMEEDWKEVSTKEDEKKMMEYAKFSRNLSTRATAVCYALILVYTVKRCLSMRTDGRLLFFPAYFPIETMTSPIFELKFIGQMIGATYYTVTYTAVDTFLAMLILHVCGQLWRLRNDLINLNSATREEFQIKLSYIVKRHDYLNRYLMVQNHFFRFIDTIENRFNIMLLFQILGCTVQLCMECFQGLLVKFKQKIHRLVCASIYLGTEALSRDLPNKNLSFQSTELAYAAYECVWYDLLPNEARSLILIIRRARTPLRLTAGKFCIFNHELYSSVLKTSMGYLSVLRATMINDEQ